MLTNPSTLGLFDEDIEEVARIFHDAGALLYYDGANLNAVCGISRPGDMGFDIVHYQPAQDVLAAARRRRAGRRADRGPRDARAVPARAGGRPRRRRVPARLRPAEVDRQGARLRRPVRRLRPLVRVHPRVRAGAARDVRGRRAERELPARAAAGRLRPAVRPALHARVRALGAHLKREHGITALDVAKRLMDYGFHPPTIYFPLVVPEALMIEPTETEPKERLDDVRRRDARDRARGGRAPGAPEGGAARPAGPAARRGAGGEAARREVPLRRASRARHVARPAPVTTWTHGAPPDPPETARAGLRAPRARNGCLRDRRPSRSGRCPSSSSTFSSTSTPPLRSCASIASRSRTVKLTIACFSAGQ